MSFHFIRKRICILCLMVLFTPLSAVANKKGIFYFGNRGVTLSVKLTMDSDGNAYLSLVGPQELRYSHMNDRDFEKRFKAPIPPETIGTPLVKFEDIVRDAGGIKIKLLPSGQIVFILNNPINDCYFLALTPIYDTEQQQQFSPLALQSWFNGSDGLPAYNVANLFSVDFLKTFFNTITGTLMEPGYGVMLPPFVVPQQSLAGDSTSLLSFHEPIVSVVDHYTGNTAVVYTYGQSAPPVSDVHFLPAITFTLTPYAYPYDEEIAALFESGQSHLAPFIGNMQDDGTYSHNSYTPDISPTSVTGYLTLPSIPEPETTVTVTTTATIYSYILGVSQVTHTLGTSPSSSPFVHPEAGLLFNQVDMSVYSSFPLPTPSVEPRNKLHGSK